MSNSFVSKSVPIRQLINVVQDKLLTYMQEVGEMPDFPFDSNLTSEEKSTELENLLYIKKNLLSKVTHAVGVLETQQSQWDNLQRSLWGEELSQELEIYSDYCNKNPSFVQMIIDGKEAVFTLESQCLEIRDLIARLRGTASGTSSNIPFVHQNTAGPSVENLRIQLPKLQLPTFYGDPLKWIEFWDAFEAAVHRQDIPPVQKFSYLLSTLKGSAYKAIEGIAVTNATYHDAVEILKNRFGDDKVIKRGLYSQLKMIPKSSSRTLELRKALENIERITRQLKSLHEDLEQPALLMLILEKLPNDILIKLGEMKLAHKEWTVDLLSQHLNEIIRNKEEAYQISNSDSRVSHELQNPNHFKMNNFKDRKNYNQFRGTTDAFVNVAHNQERKTNNNYNKLQHHNTLRKEPQKRNVICVFCGENHWNDQCSKFDLDQRKQKISEKRLCFKCFGSGHISRNCTFSVICVYCSGSHNRALCQKRFMEKQNKEFECTMNSESVRKDENVLSASSAQESNVSCSMLEREETHVVELHSSYNIKLLTSIATVINLETKQSFEVNVFLDCGSQRSYTINSLRERMKLKPIKEESLSVYTFGSKSPQQMNAVLVEFGLKFTDGSIQRMVMSSVSHLTENIRQVMLPENDRQFLSTFNIFHQTKDQNAVRPEILIGIDYFWDIMGNVQSMKLPSGLYLISSKIGFVLSGRMIETQRTVVSGAIAFTEEMKEELNIENFWNLEGLGINDDSSITENEVALKTFNDTIRFDGNSKRYGISWPWRDNKNDLPDNFGLSMGRFRSVIKRLEDNPDLLQKYDQIIQDQLDKGIIEKVQFDDSKTLKHYLPHHPVITPQKNALRFFSH